MHHTRRPRAGMHDAWRNATYAPRPRDWARSPPPLQCGGSTLRLHSSENRCVGWPPKPRCTSGRNARAMRFSSSRAMPVDLPRPDSFRPCCISMCAACQGRLDGLHRRIAMRIMEKDGTPPPRGSTILANVAARTGGRAKKSHRVGGRDMRSERRRHGRCTKTLVAVRPVDCSLPLEEPPRRPNHRLGGTWDVADGGRMTISSILPTRHRFARLPGCRPSRALPSETMIVPYVRTIWAVAQSINQSINQSIIIIIIVVWFGSMWIFVRTILLSRGMK